MNNILMQKQLSWDPVSKNVANWHSQLDATLPNLMQPYPIKMQLTYPTWCNFTQLRCNLEIYFLRIQQLILLVDSSVFSDFPISDGIMFQVLGPRYLKLLRPLLTALIGPVVESVCDRSCRVYFFVQIIHS